MSAWNLLGFDSHLQGLSCAQEQTPLLPIAWLGMGQEPLAVGLLTLSPSPASCSAGPEARCMKIL